MEKRVYTIVKVVDELLAILERMSEDLEYQRIAREVYSAQIRSLRATLEELRAS